MMNESQHQGKPSFAFKTPESEIPKKTLWQTIKCRTQTIVGSNQQF